jgi:hypothetical protein
MDGWLNLFLFIVFGAFVNLIVAFFVLRGTASALGVPSSVNSPGRALESVVTILPVAGFAGVPFFLIPFMGPILGIFISGVVASMMLSVKYSIEQGEATRIIIPTVAAIYAMSGLILYYGLPMVLPLSP